MKRVGGLLSLCLTLAACDPPPAPKPEPVAAKPAPAAPRAPIAVPVEDRPVMGKLGDATCTRSDNELSLGMDDTSCLSLLKDTIKIDPGADSNQLKLARLRVVFHQPGPLIDGKTAGWALFATRTHCATEEINVMGNVIYSPEGVEISRSTPIGSRLGLPGGLTAETLMKAVCK